jgi:hypothetical protein
VPEYRIYAIGPHNRILRAPEVEHWDTDDEALIRATGMATPSTGAEVWMGTRLVCKVPPLASIPQNLAAAGEARPAYAPS